MRKYYWTYPVNENDFIIDQGIDIRNDTCAFLIFRHIFNVYLYSNTPWKTFNEEFCKLATQFQYKNGEWIDGIFVQDIFATFRDNVPDWRLSHAKVYGSDYAFDSSSIVKTTRALILKGHMEDLDREIELGIVTNAHIKTYDFLKLVDNSFELKKTTFRRRMFEEYSCKLYTPDNGDVYFL